LPPPPPGPKKKPGPAPLPPQSHQKTNIRTAPPPGNTFPSIFKYECRCRRIPRQPLGPWIRLGIPAPIPPFRFSVNRVYPFIPRPISKSGPTRGNGGVWRLGNLTLLSRYKPKGRGLSLSPRGRFSLLRFLRCLPVVPPWSMVPFSRPIGTVAPGPCPQFPRKLLQDRFTPAVPRGWGLVGEHPKPTVPAPAPLGATLGALVPPETYPEVSQNNPNWVPPAGGSPRGKKATSYSTQVPYAVGKRSPGPSLGPTFAPNGF